MTFLNPVDVHVGARIRASRVFRGFDLWELASAIRISSSLLVAYETGSARCSAEHLSAIAETLNVRSSLFFDGLRKKAATARFPVSSKMATADIALNDNVVGPDRKRSI